jgi:hypothetical protein
MKKNVKSTTAVAGNKTAESNNKDDNVTVNANEAVKKTPNETVFKTVRTVNTSTVSTLDNAQNTTASARKRMMLSLMMP